VPAIAGVFAACRSTVGVSERPVMPRTSAQDRPRPYVRTGFYTLRKAVVTLGSRALPPKSTALGRALHEWREALILDLGGADAVST